jgi:hypothetical protein
VAAGKDRWTATKRSPSQRCMQRWSVVRTRGVAVRGVAVPASVPLGWRLACHFGQSRSSPRTRGSQSSREQLPSSARGVQCCPAATHPCGSLSLVSTPWYCVLTVVLCWLLFVAAVLALFARPFRRRRCASSWCVNKRTLGYSSAAFAPQAGVCVRVLTPCSFGPFPSSVVAFVCSAGRSRCRRKDHHPL